MSKLNNIRKFPGERGARPDNAKFRREEAAQRQAEYDKLTIKQKLAKLDEKLGPGQGAERQRARLMAQLEKQMNPQPVVEKEEAATEEKPHVKAKDRRNHDRKKD